MATAALGISQVSRDGEGRLARTALGGLAFLALESAEGFLKADIHVLPCRHLAALLHYDRQAVMKP